MDITPLTEEYTPKTLVHRGEQIKDIENEILTFKRIGVCSNLLIDGTSGSGKTVTIKYLIKKYPEQIQYHNAVELDSSILNLLNEISDKSGTTIYSALTKVFDTLSQKRIILVIDEIHKFRNIEKLWNLLNGIYRRTSIPSFVIPTRKQFVNTMPEDAKLTLLYQHVLFPAYTADEIRDILKQRLELSGASFEDDGILSAIAYRTYHLGARTAINVLRTLVCDEIKKPTPAMLDGIIHRFDAESLKTTICRMDKIEQNLMFIMADLMVTQHGRPVHTGLVTERYVEGFGTLARETISRKITNLVEYGYLTPVGGQRTAKRDGPGITRRLSMDILTAYQIQKIHDELLTAIPQKKLEVK